MLGLLVAGPAVGTSAAASATTLTISAPAPVARGHAVTFTGLLSITGGAVVGGQPVTLTRTDGTHTVGTATTASTGAWSLSDTPPVAGTVSYRAAFAGTALLGPVTVSRSVSVLGSRRC